MAYRFSVHANLEPVEALFLWADLDRVADWMDGVSGVTDVTSGRSDRPDFTLPGHTLPLVISPGSRYTLWFGRWLGRRPARFEVLYPADAESTTTYRTRVEGAFRRGEVRVTFEPEQGGSRVTLAVEPEGLVPRIVGRLLATGSYRGSFRSQLRSFARLAERERLRKLII